MPLATTFRVPFFSVEVDPTRAAQGPSILQYQVLLIGGKTASGTVAQLVKKKVSSVADARMWFGEGSQLHLMVRAFFANNKFVPLYCIALDDDGAGTAAQFTLTVTGTATEDGTIYVYIGGVRIPVLISNGDDATTIAAAINTAIGAQADLPVTSAANLGVVTLTARNKGEPGTDIDVRVNYGEGEDLPAGVSSIVVANSVAGATNPDIQDVIDVLGDEWYQVICAPYSDATNLTAIETELADRFGNIRQIPGQYIFSKDANFGTLETFGDGRNSPHVRCVDSFGVPWTSFEMAAAWAALEAASAQEDPAKPLHRQPINGVGAKPPAVADRRTLEEMNSLLFAGVSPFGITAAGKLQIARSITMYQTNAAAAEDTAFLRAETMYTLIYIRYDFRNVFLTKYPRAKLANDGAFLPAGQSIITPSIAKAEAVAIARGWEQLGLVENIEQFKKDLVVTRNMSDPDRLDFVLPPDLVNQFVVGAATLQFLLEA